MNSDINNNDSKIISNGSRKRKRAKSRNKVWDGYRGKMYNFIKRRTKGINWETECVEEQNKIKLKIIESYESCENSIIKKAPTEMQEKCYKYFIIRLLGKSPEIYVNYLIDQKKIDYISMNEISETYKKNQIRGAASIRTGRIYNKNNNTSSISNKKQKLIVKVNKTEETNIIIIKKPPNKVLNPNFNSKTDPKIPKQIKKTVSFTINIGLSKNNSNKSLSKNDVKNAAQTLINLSNSDNLYENNNNNDNDMIKIDNNTNNKQTPEKNNQLLDLFTNYNQTNDYNNDNINFSLNKQTNNIIDIFSFQSVMDDNLKINDGKLIVNNTIKPFYNMETPYSSKKSYDNWESNFYS